MNNPTPPAEKSRVWFRWMLLGWIGVLLYWSYRSRTGSLNVSVVEMMGRAALVAMLREVIVGTVSSFVLYLPVGCLVVLSAPRPLGETARLLSRKSVLVALTLTLATGLALLQRRSLLWADLVFPWTACLIGCWAGFAWLGGSIARLRFIRGLLLLTAGLFAALACVSLFAIESTPLPLKTTPITSDEKRRLYEKFSGKNPKKLAKDAVVEIRFNADELNAVLAWGSTVMTSVRTARIDLDDSRAELRASAAVPHTSRYLNVTLAGGVSLTKGHLDLWAERARIGRIELPRWLIRASLPLISRIANEDERSRQLLQLLKSVELRAGLLRVTYGYSNPPKGFVARLFHDPSNQPNDVPMVRAQIQYLVAHAPSMPEDSDARLGAAVQAAFRFAQERSSSGQSVAQNRTALLALGIVLGHHRIQSLTGPVMDEDTAAAAEKAYGYATLRSRADWTKHFFVSAALTVIAAEDVSNATGLFKEEKDADGGSGFSFGDLLADRSGTTFAEVATRSEASARSIQERLKQGFRVDDYFPEGKDLPENIQDSELKSRYGGVGGELYGRWMMEIERRISECPAYRQ